MPATDAVAHRSTHAKRTPPVAGKPSSAQAMRQPSALIRQAATTVPRSVRNIKKRLLCTGNGLCPARTAAEGRPGIGEKQWRARGCERAGTRRFPVQGPEEREGVRGTRRFPVQGPEEREGVRGTRRSPVQGPEERERGARHAALPRAGAGGAGRGAGHAALPRAGAGGAGRGAGHAALPCGARGAERTSL